MKTFLKSDQVQLINGGYLSSNEGKPVNNADFVQAQKRAEYVCTFAKLAKGKTFKASKVDSLEALKAEVAAELATKDTTYVDVPEKFVKELSNQLADEAKKFMENQDEISKVEKINSFLQEFNVLNEFEEFGLFFEDGIVKLNKIYSLEEVVNAVKETIDILG